jgi:asparagine synthase (glutamine-hydrolysing)
LKLQLHVSLSIHQKNKEEYLYRSIFESHFPSDAAAKTVPSVKSVACSTPEALAWDASFQNLNDPSGRAVANVHNESYDKKPQTIGA